MDIRETMRQISELEKEKAQVELLASQLKDTKAELEKRMAEAGVTSENIDTKIAELEDRIQSQLALIRAGGAPQPKKEDEFSVLDI